MLDIMPYENRGSNSLMNDFYKFIFGQDSLAPLMAKSSCFPIDVEDKETEYVVSAQLPGVSKDSISIEADTDKLTISVTETTNNENEEKNFIHRETTSYSASRTIRLADLDEAAITAKLEDGVLSIVCPKQPEENSAHTIEIQ